MPGYIQAELHRFQHSPPSRKEHALHSWERKNYGATQQFTKAEDTSQKLPPERTLKLQQITVDVIILCKSDRFDHTGRAGNNSRNTNKWDN